MKHLFRPHRRNFLVRVLGAAGLGAVAACDRLSQSEKFTQLLGQAEHVNRRLYHAITRSKALAEEFPESALSKHFPSNGTSRPLDPDYLRFAANGFGNWRLEVSGLVERPAQLSLPELRALPSRTQITRHDCVEGWSAIAKWKGARLSALLERVGMRPQARFVVFYCFDTMTVSGAKYYESIDMEDAFHPQTILAYAWNDEVLPTRYGAPLRLRLERQLGYKMAKYIRRIELVESLDGIRGGKGGFWEDQGYEWYAGI